MARTTADPDGSSSCLEANDESYDTAVAALLSPLHQATTPAAIRAAAARRRNTLHDMHEYFRRLGLNLNHPTKNDSKALIPPLIFHVTGTKGKGSTLAFCESILRNGYGLHTGMFTSPHLVSIRERIRIDGIPVSKKVFGQVYWRVRRKLETHQSDNKDADGDGEENGDGLPPLPTLPGYFRMITLMALYTFFHYQNPPLDVILLEVGMGGRYDATNLFDPSITSASYKQEERLLIRGVTLIDYDHTRVLGSTLTQIAWEKGGIFVRDKLKCIGMKDGGYNLFVENNVGQTVQEDELKRNNDGQGESSSDNEKISPSSTVFVNGNNTPEVLDVLGHIAKEHECQMQTVCDSYLEEEKESFSKEIGLRGDHQRSNAALALSMCRYAMEKSSLSMVASSEKLQSALTKAFWPGRCHTVSLPSLSSNGLDLSMNLRCDGAHTPISMNACIDWFRNVVQVPITSTTANPMESHDEINGVNSLRTHKIDRVLIFNCSHERNPLPLLFSLLNSWLFDSVYFCHADFERPSAVPKRLEDGWMKESLCNEYVNGGVPVTLEGMCAKMAVSSGSGGYDGQTVELDPTKLSASTWQETLANVWRVFDMYWRYEHGGVDGLHLAANLETNVTVGLKVKDAIAAIQDEVMKDCNAMGRGGRVMIEACVTGSLYIVGSALEAAGWEEGEALGGIC